MPKMEYPQKKGLSVGLAEEENMKRKGMDHV